MNLSIDWFYKLLETLSAFFDSILIAKNAANIDSDSDAIAEVAIIFYIEDTKLWGPIDIQCEGHSKADWNWDENAKRNV